VIYLADSPFRIPRFTHHSADLSAFLDSAFYFPRSAFYQYSQWIIGNDRWLNHVTCDVPTIKLNLKEPFSCYRKWLFQSYNPLYCEIRQFRREKKCLH